MWTSGRGLLLATAAGHDAPLAAMLVVAVLLIGAVAAIILVSLAHRDDRVDAIHAAAEVLAALLPWPSRGRAPRRAQNTGPRRRPRIHDDHSSR
jgi:hypothetical protein